MNKEVCGTCMYHRYSKDGWYCVNSVSEYYTDYTEYTDTCDEYEER